MSEAKHTPGPWLADSVVSEAEHDIILGYRVPDAGHPILLATVYRDEDRGPITLAQANANARLIAAAPDLLDVAKAYERWEADLILCQEAWRGGLADLPTLTWKLWDRLLEIQAMRNAALAKAKGESRG